MLHMATPMLLSTPSGGSAAFSSDSTGTVFMASTFLSLSSIFIGREPSNPYRGFVRFSGVSIPQGATIVSAVLSVNQSNFSGSIAPSLRIANTDNAPALTGSDIAGVALAAPSVATVLAGSAQSYTVTSLVQAVINRAGWVAGNSLMLIGQELPNTGSTDFVQWTQHNNATPAFRPVLTVTWG
jgi:hypothetical protein